MADTDNKNLKEDNLPEVRRTQDESQGQPWKKRVVKSQTAFWLDKS